MEAGEFNELVLGEALLEPGDVAGERGLGDVRALRGRTDRARLGDGKCSDSSFSG